MKTYYLKKTQEVEKSTRNTRRLHGLYINSVLLRGVSLLNQYLPEYHFDRFDVSYLYDLMEGKCELDWTSHPIEHLETKRFWKDRGWQPVTSNGLLPFGDLDEGLCQRMVREYASRSDNKTQPLDEIAALWMVDSCKKRGTVRSLSGTYVIEVLLHDDQSPVTRSICFWYQGVQFRILLQGNRSKARKTGNQLGIEHQDTNKQSLSMELSRRLKVRTEVEESSSTKIALDESLLPRTGPYRERDYTPGY